MENIQSQKFCYRLCQRYGNVGLIKISNKADTHRETRIYNQTNTPTERIGIYFESPVIYKSTDNVSKMI